MATKPKPKPIVVATDGSTAADHAVRYAAALAKRRGTELVLLHIVSFKKVGYWGFIDSHFKKELRVASDKVLDTAEATAKEYGVTCRRMIREAERYPHQAIVDAVEEMKDVWVLVVGDKGEDLEARHALGSTTNGVLHELSKRQLPVPVLVVPSVADVELTI
ncbi:MAG: universal stress protein [Phycisphaerae bacterium]|nr:universal stress protein [Phycisphaerae bacterium]